MRLFGGDAFDILSAAYNSFSLAELLDGTPEEARRAHIAIHVLDNARNHIPIITDNERKNGRLLFSRPRFKSLPPEVWESI